LIVIDVDAAVAVVSGVGVLLRRMDRHGLDEELHGQIQAAMRLCRDLIATSDR
jgi:hypothetical protein